MHSPYSPVVHERIIVADWAWTDTLLLSFYLDLYINTYLCDIASLRDTRPL